MTSSRKISMASAYVSDKRLSQWEELMKKFSGAHKQQCKSAPLDIPRAQRSTKYFPTGSQYKGTWDYLGMSGHGIYEFPNGVVYRGDFEDGMFHGQGELCYEDGVKMHGKWEKGVMVERTLQLSDSLEFSETDWKYCVMPDRRFAIEYELDLMPAGKSFLTAEQPSKEIPPGFYDSGDGFYNPKTRAVYKYENFTSIMRSPSDLEHKWIVANCRKAPDEPLGPLPELYEEWSEPVECPQTPPSPAAGIKTNASRCSVPSASEQDFHFPKGFKFGAADSSSESSTSSSDQ